MHSMATSLISRLFRLVALLFQLWHGFTDSGGCGYLCVRAIARVFPCVCVCWKKFLSFVCLNWSECRQAVSWLARKHHHHHHRINERITMCIQKPKEMVLFPFFLSYWFFTLCIYRHASHIYEERRLNKRARQLCVFHIGSWVERLQTTRYTPR